MFDSLLNKKLLAKKSIVNCRSWWYSGPFLDISYLRNILCSIHQERNHMHVYSRFWGKKSVLWIKKTLTYGGKQTFIILNFFFLSLSIATSSGSLPQAVLCSVPLQEEHLEKGVSLGVLSKWLPNANGWLIGHLHIQGHAALRRGILLFHCWPLT